MVGVKLRSFKMVNPDYTMPTRSVRAFVWDLADEGLDEVLGYLRDSGVDGMHLALAAHGGRFYCPHNPKHCLVHAPEGALYFQPILSCYEGLRPYVHPEYGSGAFLARASEALHDYGMSCAAWLVLFNNKTLSVAHPGCVTINALGDRLEGALCPSNPTVRSYAQALVEDLAHRVGVDVIELEDFAFCSHEAYVGPCWQGIHVGPGLGYLLSLCFCEHCRRRAEEANIEVEDLLHHVERMIRSALAGDLSERRIGDEISDPYHPIARYAKVRCETITSLLDELLDAADGSQTVLQPILAEEPDECWRWGIELHTFRQRMMRATIKTAHSAHATQALIERYAEVMQLGHDLAADVNMCVCKESGENSLAANVEACTQAGVDRFIFSHYGLASLEMLEWIGGLARHS